MQARTQQRDMNLHNIIFKPNNLLDGPNLSYYVKGQWLLDGYKVGSGICFRCYNNEMDIN